MNEAFTFDSILPLFLLAQVVLVVVDLVSTIKKLLKKMECVENYCITAINYN